MTQRRALVLSHRACGLAVEVLLRIQGWRDPCCCSCFRGRALLPCAQWEGIPLACGFVQSRAALFPCSPMESGMFPSGPRGSGRLCLHPGTSSPASTALPAAPTSSRLPHWVPAVLTQLKCSKKLLWPCFYGLAVHPAGTPPWATLSTGRACSLPFHFLPGRRRGVSFKYNAESSGLLSRACLIADAAGAPGLVLARAS